MHGRALAGGQPPGRRKRLAATLFEAEGLERASVYFAHYLFEACRELGPMAWARGSVAHPRGPIAVGLRREGPRVAGTVDLPAGVTGALLLGGERREFTGAIEL